MLDDSPSAWCEAARPYVLCAARFDVLASIGTRHELETELRFLANFQADALDAIAEPSSGFAATAPPPPPPPRLYISPPPPPHASFDHREMVAGASFRELVASAQRRERHTAEVAWSPPPPTPPQLSQPRACDSFWASPPPPPRALVPSPPPRDTYDVLGQHDGGDTTVKAGDAATPTTAMSRQTLPRPSDPRRRAVAKRKRGPESPRDP